jgi:hypothetical protein
MMEKETKNPPAGPKKPPAGYVPTYEDLNIQKEIDDLKKRLETDPIWTHDTIKASLKVWEDKLKK